jgi:serine/threonine protein kinase
VDYWALGVLVFELAAGVPPFYADDPMEVKDEENAYCRLAQAFVRGCIALFTSYSMEILAQSFELGCFSSFTSYAMDVLAQSSVRGCCSWDDLPRGRLHR